MLLACRYRSLKLYLSADKFKDLTYVKQSLLLVQLGKEIRGVEVRGAADMDTCF